MALLISGIKSSSAQRWELTLRNRSHEVNSVYPKKAERERTYTLPNHSTLCLISPPPPKKRKKLLKQEAKLTEINKELYYYEIGYLIREFEGQYQKCLTFRC